jgi:arylsulfatase A-like enzyme
MTGFKMMHVSNVHPISNAIRRRLVNNFFGLLLLMVISGCNGPANKPAKEAVVSKRPNIIFIFSDDHAYQAIGAYGNRIAKTPNIDRIAAGGATFSNFMVTNSICGPSRACLLTGKYNHINGFTGNDKKFDINQEVFTRLLKGNGYQTAWIGKWHLGTLPADAFDYWNILPDQGRYFNPQFISQQNDTSRIEGYVTDIITDMATRWLDQQDSSKPFFMVIGHKATHRQWLPDLKDLGAYDSIQFPLPDNFYDNYKGRIAAAEQDMSIEKTMLLDYDLKVNVNYDSNWVFRDLNADQKKAYQAYYGDKISKEYEQVKNNPKALTEWKYQRYMKDYLATANSLDRNIGRILQYLDEKGLAENTIVMYGADQGFYLGEHGWFDKRFMYEESLRTPFLMRYPALIKPGTKVDDMLLNIDWAPTILDIAQTPIPSDMQGKSFLPVLQHPRSDKPFRDLMYYHYYEFPEPHHVYPHFGVRSKKYKLIRFYGEKNFWELYDLEKDPKEMRNVYGDASYADIDKAMKKELNNLILQYKDTMAQRLMNLPAIESAK